MKTYKRLKKRRALISAFLLVISSFLIFSCSSSVFADGAKDDVNVDEAVNGILSGIEEKDFEFITDELDKLFGDKLSFKDRLLKIVTGDIQLTFGGVISYLSGRVKNNFGVISKVLALIIAIGVLCSASNIILSKNNGNIEKNIVFYICYSLVCVIVGKLLYEVVEYSVDTINDFALKIEKVFPLLFSLSAVVGDFGVSLYKPYVAFLSFFTSGIAVNFFLPVLLVAAVAVTVGNVSEGVKLSELSKTLFSFFKWSLGLFTLIFTIIIGSQGVVNAQYNGASVKILKYATGSLVPIAGGFLSGGMDVLLSSCILVKNSVGLAAIIWLVLSVAGTGLSVIIISFVIKFIIGLCEPALDARFTKAVIGISDVLTSLAALIFVCGYVFILTVIMMISATAAVF